MPLLTRRAGSKPGNQVPDRANPRDRVSWLESKAPNEADT